MRTLITLILTIFFPVYLFAADIDIDSDNNSKVDGAAEAVAAGWNADPDAPTKNDIHDYEVVFDTDLDGDYTDEAWWTEDVAVDGTTPLTSNWDVGAYTITGTRFISDIAIGTSPFAVTSTTVVTNLNADTVDGESASAFEDADAAIVKSDEAETISSEWTFGEFPITPSGAPDADYEVANKKYIDDAIITAGGGDVTGVGDCASGACLDGSSDGGSYVRIYDGDSHYGEIQIPNVAGNVTITTPAATSTLLATDGAGSSLTAVDAITGDSATAFFDAGALEAEFGGTGIDLSSTTGIMGITAGTYTDVDTATELETLAGLGAFFNEYADDADAATMNTTMGQGTGDSPQFAAVNIGAATDTTIARSGAGDITVEGNQIYRAGGTDIPDGDIENALTITNTPAGNIAAVTRQAAIDELDDEKEPLLSNSAGLAAALSDETGTGLNVHQTSPTLVTPTLGVATATNVTSTLTDVCHTSEPTALLVVGRKYCAKDPWDPTGTGTIIDHWVRYIDDDPVAWELVDDTAGNVYFKSLEISSIEKPNVAYSTSQLLSVAEMSGHQIYATGALTYTLQEVFSGAGFKVVVIGAYSVSIDPNIADRIWLNGTELNDGDKITSDGSTGQMAECTYYSATGFFCDATGWTDGGGG